MVSEKSFKAGAAEIDITPPLGTLINGDFINHYSQKIYDRLHAKALVLNDGALAIVFVVVDVCAMQKDFIDQVKEDIYLHTGLPKKQIMISSTHTHAAGSIASLLLGSVDLAYRFKLRGLIVDAVLQAIGAQQSASLAFGRIKVPEHLQCRRYYMTDDFNAINPVTGLTDQIKTNPFGAESQILTTAAPIDPDLSFFAVRDLKGVLFGLLANYSLHYVGDWENGTICSDYFGEFAAALRRKVGQNSKPVIMMSNGTSGDVNIWDFKFPDRYPHDLHKKRQLIAEDLAAKTGKELNTLKWDNSPALDVIYQEILVETRKPSLEELEAARVIVSQSNFETIKSIDHDALVQIYAREQLLLAEYQDVILFVLQGIKIGEVTIGCIGGEFFSETGLWLKEQLKNRFYFTITMANDYTGYVPPAHEIDKGGYETWRCRTSYLVQNAESIIRQRLLEMVSQL